MLEMIFKPEGICCKEIRYEVCQNGTIKNIEFIGGCPGGLQAISRLCNGKNAVEIIQILSGITCGKKETSCGDQLAKALKGPIK